MALSLYRLSQFNIAEIRRGRACEGNYILRTGLVPQSSSITNVSPTDPTEMVETISNAGAIPPEAQPSSPRTRVSSQLPATSQPSDEQSVDDTPAMETAMLTTRERASVIIASGKIALDTKLAVFTVIGTTEPRVVRLFPQPSCSCPSQYGCYHVMAAK